jgi:hypothetical protein
MRLKFFNFLSLTQSRKNGIGFLKMKIQLKNPFSLTHFNN